MADFNLDDIRAGATQFFDAVAGLIAVKDARIAVLEAELRASKEVLDGLANIKSDFMLLKDKATADAKRAADRIANLLPDPPQS